MIRGWYTATRFTRKPNNLAHDPPRRGRLRMTVRDSDQRQHLPRTARADIIIRQALRRHTIKAAAADIRELDFWSGVRSVHHRGDELMRLAIGERVTSQGGLKLEIFRKEGQRGYRERIFVDHVMALRQPPKERKPKARRQAAKAADAIDGDTGEKRLAAGARIFQR